MADTPQIWVPLSGEQRWLLRHARWLVAPIDGHGSKVAQALRFAMIAPMTQLTFVSFDMQCFLYQVFHLTWIARIGHLLGMTAETLFLLAAGSRLPLGSSGLHLGHVFAGVLAVWHVGVALSVGLRAWAVVALLLQVGLLLAGEALAPALTAWQALGGWHTWLASPWLLALASAFVVAASHVPEPKLPPRAVSGGSWRSVVSYVFGKGESIGFGRKVVRLVRVSAFIPLGTLNELWAGLRLMPYGWLMLLFRLGYQPALWAELQRREREAMDSGNPAIDFVGVGGGAMLADDAAGGYVPRAAA